MFKIDSSGNVAGMFTNGDPATGVPATVVSDQWLNAIQTELVNVATSTGAALDKADSTQVLTAIQALIAASSKGYKRDFSPNNAYSTLSAFLAGTYVSLGQCPTTGGEIVEARDSGGANDSTLYSMVVRADAACTVSVVAAFYDNNVALYLDGALKNTWSGAGEGTSSYAMVLSAGTHVVQFLDINSSAGPAGIYINDWMTGNPVKWLRAAHS